MKRKFKHTEWVYQVDPDGDGTVFRDKYLRRGCVEARAKEKLNQLIQSVKESTVN